MSELDYGSRLMNARLRDEIRELKGGLRGIDDRKGFGRLRPRKDLFRSDGSERQLGFELPKMMILKNRDRGMTDRKQFLCGGSFSNEPENNEEDLDNLPVEGNENNIQALILKDSKTRNSKDKLTEMTQIPLKSSETCIADNKMINSTFSSFYENTSSPILHSKIPKISSPNLENIPRSHINTSPSIPDQSNSLILQIKSLHQENKKLHQKLKNPLPKPLKKILSNNSRSSSPLSKKSLTPRQQHCQICDLLLSKGYSTVHCSKHSLY